MRFAITACDRNLKLFEEFLNAGWQPVKLFSSPEINSLSTNKAVMALAQSKKIPIQLSRIREDDLRGLQQMQCDVLIIGSYNWRIPDWRPYLPYAINFHPSPLPIGRGPYPVVNAILRECQAWAITCHQVEAEFDTGAILDSEHFALTAYETHESLNIKLQMASGRIAKRVAQHFEVLWQQATAQTSGEYWPLFSAQDQTVNFFQSATFIQRQLRAFGQLGCIASVNQKQIFIKSGFAWPEAHELLVSQIAHIDGMTVVVACLDGYVAISDWHFV